jgi:HEPN domain-containing protein
MACDRLGLVAQRLAAADEDIAAAEKLASGEPLLAPAIYHCTLAGEKALKAYLLYRDMEAPVTHDLTQLIDRLSEAEPQAERLRSAAERLTPYAVAYRSIEPLAPSRDEFEAALELAYGIHDYVSERMPELAAE